MRRLNLTLVLVLLAVPATAAAKGGIELDKDPGTLAPGELTGFRLMLMREAPDGPGPVVGVRPLVTFRETDTGALVRVRARPTNRDGVARGAVAFPFRGTWEVALANTGGALVHGGDRLPVGIAAPDLPAEARGLPPETYVPPPAPGQTESSGGGFPALPAGAGVAALALAAAALIRRRRGSGHAGLGGRGQEGAA